MDCNLPNPNPESNRMLKRRKHIIYNFLPLYTYFCHLLLCIFCLFMYYRSFYVLQVITGRLQPLLCKQRNVARVRGAAQRWCAAQRSAGCRFIGRLQVYCRFIAGLLQVYRVHIYWFPLVAMTFGYRRCAATTDRILK